MCNSLYSLHELTNGILHNTINKSLKTLKIIFIDYFI